MKGSQIKTYPLKQLSLEQATQMQFKLVDIMRRYFNGKEQLRSGDYGRRVTDEVYEGEPVYRHPDYTIKVEKVLAEFFNAKEATLTRRAGTGAIQQMFIAAVNPGDQVIVDDTYVYPTTNVIMRAMGLDTVHVDMDHLGKVKEAVSEKTKAVYVTYAPGFKKYRLSEVIKAIRSTKFDPLIMSDDNYVAGRVEKIGVQLGADLSTFSIAKAFGAWLGVVIGGTERGVRVIKQMRVNDKSGGGSIAQGPEAFDSLKMLVYAPVMYAIQKNVCEEICERLNKGEVNGVDWAVILNCFSRLVFVKLKEPIAKKVYEVAWKHGSQATPIASEGRHEIVGRVGTVSISFMKTLGMQDIPVDYFLRVHSYHAGPNTIIDILRKSIEEAKKLN